MHRRLSKTESSVRRYGSGLVLAAVLALSTGARAQNAPAVNYAFNTLGISEGDASYVDRFAGPDMLPYTADDIELPERGNIGGTWGFAHFDVDSDGAITDDERIFTVTRRDDDDAFNFSALTHIDLGVIYEAEDWIDYHEARNQGPSATLAPDLGAEGNDFEHNDSPSWCGESNVFLYNHARANQHGRGKPRYYFDFMNPGSAAAEAEPFVLDEIEGWVKPLTFQNNLDDPTTPLDERNTCRRTYFTTQDQVVRGYLIPVEGLEELENGSLPSLFGWEAPGFDLATWLRDTIAPLLATGEIQMFHPGLGTTIPADITTHLVLYQIEVPIVINNGNLCGLGDAQAVADYWGLPLEGATYRVSHLLGYSDELTLDLFGDTVRTFGDLIDAPEKNLWLLEHFMRDDRGHLGNYSLVPEDATFIIEDDPSFATFDQTNNSMLTTTTGGLLRAPLSRAIARDEQPLELVVDAGLLDESEATGFQLVLFSGDDVAAWAELTEDDTIVRVGGSVGADGWTTGGEGTIGPDVAVLGAASAGEFTRWILRVSTSRIEVLEAQFGDYEPNQFDHEELDLAVLASLDLGAGGLADIDGIGVALSGRGAVSTIAVLAGFPGAAVAGGLQRPIDCNQDGNVDISDGICLLGHLFLGNPQILPCGDGTIGDAANIALLDGDDSQSIQLTDAISLFNFLFLGGASPAPCVDGLCRECIEIQNCPTVCGN